MLRVVSSRTAYENPWMAVREDTFVRPDGSEGLYGVVVRRDFACLVPWDGERLWLVEQHRHPVGAWSLELPQGGWDPGDPGDGGPEALARLELREETGLAAGALRHLGHLWTGVGGTSQGFDCWLATDLAEGDADRGREEEASGMRVVRLTPDELDDAIREGRVRDSSTLAALALLDRAGGLP